MNNFSTLGLSQPVLDAVDDMGFEQPTEIQVLVIPQILDNKSDIIGLAQTGTGKTGAFGLPLVDLVDPQKGFPQALILAPTRELAVQISKELQAFAIKVKALNIVTVYGGADIRGQIKQIRAGAQIIVATPGRLKDLMNRKRIDISKVEYLVLDEADEMLNMGFREELDYILEGTPAEKRTWLFSATMSAEVQKMSRRFMQSPVELTVGPRNASNENIDHQYINLPHHSRKYEALRRIMDYHPDFFGLIFCRTRRETRDMASKLIADGYNADALHGDLSQSQRDLVMERFRSGSLKAVVATDVAARGLDVDDITHVIHFNIPEDIAFYTHRSGRTGRAGKKGISILLAGKRDQSRIRAIEKHAKINFEERSVPTGEEICQRHLRTSLQEIKNADANQDIKPFLPMIYQELKDFSREQLIEQIAAYNFTGMLERYRDLPDLNAKSSKGRFNGTRLFINIGRMDNLDKGSFLRLVCDHAGISGSSIGLIDLQHTYTYFYVEKNAVSKVVASFNDTHMDGRMLRVNPADGFPSKKGKKKKKKKN